jgi:hypothetical protein
LKTTSASKSPAGDNKQKSITSFFTPKSWHVFFYHEIALLLSPSSIQSFVSGTRLSPSIIIRL